MKTLMLSVGISNYAHRRIPDLKLCAPDARQMAQAFRDLTSHEFQSSLLLNEQATKANIYAEIESLAQAANKRDRVIFYFSGHGARYEDLYGDEADGYDEFLCPYDTGLEKSRKSFIRDDELHQWLSPIRQKTNEVVLIFDCCHSGSAHMAPGEAVAKEIPVDVVKSLLGDYEPKTREMVGLALDIVPGQLLLAACQEYQLAHEIRSWKHGIFTTYLLEGLNKAYIQSYQQLFDYASEKVEGIAAMYKLQQTPNLLDGLDEELALR